MADDAHKSYTVRDARETLEKLHELIVQRCQRIEIRRDGCDDCCVLISKAELECLEQALEILAHTDAVRTMSERLAQLAALTTQGEFAVPESAKSVQ